MSNFDPKTIASFGDEWTRFDQQAMPEEEARAVFNDYFRVFPWERLTAQAEGFDMGCGSGRWAKWVLPKVGRLHCIDSSDAIEVARRNLAGSTNALFHRASFDDARWPRAAKTSATPWAFCATSPTRRLRSGPARAC